LPAKETTYKSLVDKPLNVSNKLVRYSTVIGSRQTFETGTPAVITDDMARESHMFRIFSTTGPSCPVFG